MLSLHTDGLRLTLAPEIGGSIARFDAETEEGWRPVMRGAEGTPSHALECASFPLVPYSNRIRGGAFAFRGREIEIAANMAGDRNPLHGHGWLAPWSVVRSDQRSAELVFVHEAGEWPWRYEARQELSIDREGLEMRLSCTNLAPGPMPCGLGQHPYFPCDETTRLDTAVASAWTIDDDVLPVALVRATGRFDLRDRTICGQGLDNGFEGWGQEASIRSADISFETRIRSSDASRFQVYSPAAGGFFVAEPIQAANAVLNEDESEWPRLGLAVLEPGQMRAMTMRVDVVREE